MEQSEQVQRVRTGVDGIDRCWWCGDAPDYVDYHDHEWGRPTRGDVALYELATLESFQSGLSWLTILRKRDGFRAAFAGFDPEVVATYEEPEVRVLLHDAGIVRHRGKIEAAVANARAIIALQRAGRSFDELVWSFAPAPRSAPLGLVGELPSATAESTALAKDLKRRGFRFLGPTTVYAFMQAAGMVDDHVAGCFRAGGGAAVG